MLRNKNSKLGENIFNFSISRDSCLHKTESCDKYCYAKKGNYAYRNVKKGLQKNFDLTKQENFIDLISAQITLLKIQNKIKYIRIHPSGDFYSQKYYEKWNEIAIRNPELVFLTYTRNYEIDFSNRAENLIIYYSLDRDTKELNNTLSLYAYVLDKKRYADTKHMEHVPEKNCYICNSKCYECKFCFHGKKNVAFVQR